MLTGTRIAYSISRSLHLKYMLDQTEIDTSYLFKIHRLYN